MVSKRIAIKTSKRRKKGKRSFFTRKTSIHKLSDINVKNGNGVEKWCHHGHLTEKHRLVECNKCQSTRFCLPCMLKWYPNVSEEEFVKACPVCCHTCNCKECLRQFSSKDMQQGYSCFDYNRVEYSKKILENVLPFVTSLNEEQLIEKEIEAKIEGLSVSEELQLEETECDVDEDICCDNCEGYIFDMYRSCGSCGYDLCLLCCRELRDGKLRWKASIDGSIPCPTIYLRGCNEGILKLKRTEPLDSVANMLKKAQGIYKTDPSNNSIPQTCMECSTSLYSVSAKDIQLEDMKHFQLHWSKGEPIIVRNVPLSRSWEPMVLWRAFNDIIETSNDSHDYEVNAVNCFDWSEVGVDLFKFFKGYAEGWPVNMKLEDWRPYCLSVEEPPLHIVELIKSLPFKDYAHPHQGYLNVVTKLPDSSLKPDMGPRMDIAYRYTYTKLHCHMSDTVNVLTHILPIKLKRTKLVKQKHAEEGTERKEDQQHVADPMEGSVVWDIFRRQDIPKLAEYLRNNSTKLIVHHPIHDRSFYLTTEHKRKLKEKFGIEPWTLTQKLGDAVFIPAGCPYQVRNFQSCTKVEVNFVSPESLGECIRLQHEIRTLPCKHRAKKENLNIGKLMMYALKHAVTDLAGVLDSNRLEFAKEPEILIGDYGNHTNGWISETDNDEETTSDQNIGMWQGYAVGLEAKEFLNAVQNRYPNTFQGARMRCKKIWLSILEQFHVVIKGFIETSIDELTEDNITTLHENLKYFEKLGFDLSWAHQRLDMVETIKFGDDSLRKELMALQETLEPLRESLVLPLKKFMEAYDIYKQVQLTYDNTQDALNNKVQQVAQKFGVEYHHILKRPLGYDMFPGLPGTSCYCSSSLDRN